MNEKRVQKKIAWTEADRQRHRKVRELFKDKPSIDELVSRGELSGVTMPMRLDVEMLQLLHDLKKARESASLSLADLAERTGMDKAVLSKLERDQKWVIHYCQRKPTTPLANTQTHATMVCFQFFRPGAGEPRVKAVGV